MNDVYTSWLSFLPLDVLLGRSSGLMKGTTPPCEMTTSPRSLFSLMARSAKSSPDRRPTHSSSFRMASCKCRGTIRCFLLSRAALPASSRISAARYSKTAARYTGRDVSKQHHYDGSGSAYLVHLHRHAGHSCPSSGDGGHDRQGTGGQPLPSGTETWIRRRPCQSQTLLCHLCQT